jgi:threonine/homoserine/homoserine lactone efflux protein
VATAPPLPARTETTRSPSLAGGALLGVANPKAWVAIAAVFASTRLADNSAADATAKVALLTVMIVVICALWLLAGATLAPLFRDPRRARILNGILAASLIVATALAILD